MSSRSPAGAGLRIAKPTRPPNPDGVDPTKVGALQGRDDPAASLSVGFIPRGGTTHGMPLRGTRNAVILRFALLTITPNDGPLRAHAAAQAAVMGLRSTSYPSLRSVLTSF